MHIHLFDCRAEHGHQTYRNACPPFLRLGKCRPRALDGPRGRSANCGNELSAQCVRLRLEINQILVGEAIIYFETPDVEVIFIKAWIHFQISLLSMSSTFELPGRNEVPGYIVDSIVQVGIALKDIVDPRWTVGINRGNEAF